MGSLGDTKQEDTSGNPMPIRVTIQTAHCHRAFVSAGLGDGLGDAGAGTDGPYVGFQAPATIAQRVRRLSYARR